jgi:hypothetical protein
MLGVVCGAALRYLGALRRSDVGRDAVLTRLAAIGAAYGASYLRPVEGDRGRRLARFGRPRDDLIDPKIALDKGRTLETAGAVERAPIVAG